MDAVIYHLAGQLVEFGLPGVLVSMPLALLLGLGFKARGRWTKCAAAVLFVSLGSALLGLTLQGVQRGEVLALSRSTYSVTRQDSPALFWISAVGFGVLSLGVAGFGAALAWSACKSEENTAAHG